MRNREQTEQRILAAVTELVIGGGFPAVGINTVSRQAGVSKVLVYRYFGSFDQLLETWALKNCYWTEPNRKVPEGEGLKETAAALLAGLADDLRHNPVRREVLRWLLVDASVTAERIRVRLEERGVALTRDFLSRSGLPEGGHAEVLSSLLIGGISYLALMSDRASVYNGVPLDSDSGWERIKEGAVTISGLMFR